jgi:DNA-binding transcriptional LysR family regulator
MRFLLDKFNSMNILVKVAELQSFTRAAELLGIPKSSATNSIQELEKLAQVKLLNRTTRKVELTTAGLSYIEKCKDILSDVDEMESMFHATPGQIRGKIRVDMTSIMARDVVIPELPKFLEKYPEIEIELVGSDQTLDLIREGIDCSIRSGNSQDPRLAEQWIGDIPIINIASPGYLKKYGTPKKIEDLKNHKVIQYVQNFGGDPETFDYFEGSKTVQIKMKSLISVSNIEAYKAACIAGLGICQNPITGIKDLLSAGKLVEILPKFRIEPTRLKIVYPKKRFQAKRVRAFIDWVEPLMLKYVQD